MSDFSIATSTATAPGAVAIGADNHATHERSVVVGSGGASTEPGEIVFVTGGRNALQFFPDGRILVQGRAVVCDEQVVRELRDWLAAMVPWVAT